MISEGLEFTLRGTTFRVTQVIEPNTVYLEQQLPDGRWAGYDCGGDLQALKDALAIELEAQPAVQAIAAAG